MRGATAALENDVAVPFETVGFECVEYQPGGARLLAGRIDVFYAKKPEPFVRSGLQIAGDGGDERAEV